MNISTAAQRETLSTLVESARRSRSLRGGMFNHRLSTRTRFVGGYSWDGLLVSR